MTTESKGQRQRWRERALQMAAMRERCNSDGTRKSWAQVAKRFGVDSANACHSVKLHTSRMEPKIKADHVPSNQESQKSNRKVVLQGRTWGHVK